MAIPVTYYVVAQTKVSMIVVGTREKKVFTTSTGKLPINSMVGEKIQFVVYKPNGQPLSSTDYVAARIKEGPVKIHLSVDATKGTTGQDKPKTDKEINQDIKCKI